MGILEYIKWQLAVLRKGWKQFRFNGQNYKYFIHPYNFTWLNERSVEVSLIWQAVLETLKAKPNASILEVGNVLSHYFSIEHRVIDKYEKAPGVVQLDIVDLPAKPTYDLIVAISTFEHVGWDEQPKDQNKLARAIRACMRALRPGGRLLFTIPVGYNPSAVSFVVKHRHLWTHFGALGRTNQANDWQQAELEDVLNYQYNRPFSNANAILVVEVVRPERSASPTSSKNELA